MIFNTYFYFF